MRRQLASASPAGSRGHDDVEDRSALPPGQRGVERFPRFGTHLHRAPPPVPTEPQIEISGVLTEPLTVPLTALANLTRREMVADFHCVAGWSVTGLRWEGVPFARCFAELIEPRIPPGTTATHLVFQGLDGYRVVVLLEDALSDDVLLADHLDGRPLQPDHGAPLRVVSPGQYGFVSAKHLCRIEVHAADPQENFGHASTLARLLMVRPLFSRHPRSRVWYEERNGSLPNWLVRPLYRAFTPAIRALSDRNHPAARHPGGGSR